MYSQERELKKLRATMHNKAQGEGCIVEAYRLCLIGVGTEPSDGCCSVPSHCVGRFYFRPPFRGVHSPQDGPSNVMLTARVPDGLNPLWRSLLLQGRAYPMSELSC
jgi:hypothetical protein